MANNRHFFPFPTRWADPSTWYRRAPKLFVPSDYGTCGQWVRSSDLLDVITDPTSTYFVQTWTDQSGSGNNFSANMAAASCGAYPLFYGRAWRGFPGVRMSSTRMTSSYVPATGANVRSLVLVVSHPLYNNSTDNEYAWYGTNTALQGFGIGVATSSLTYKLYTQISTGTNTSATAQTNVPEVVIATYDGTNAKVYVNGSSVLNTALALNTSGAAGISLGSDSGSGRVAIVTIYEFAAFSADISASVTTITDVLRGQYEC
jgi:hypothetical protein